MEPRVVEGPNPVELAQKEGPKTKKRPVEPPPTYEEAMAQGEPPKSPVQQPFKKPVKNMSLYKKCVQMRLAASLKQDGAPLSTLEKRIEHLKKLHNSKELKVTVETQEGDSPKRTVVYEASIKSSVV